MTTPTHPDAILTLHAVAGARKWGFDAAKRFAARRRLGKLFNLACQLELESREMPSRIANLQAKLAAAHEQLDRLNAEVNFVRLRIPAVRDACIERSRQIHVEGFQPSLDLHYTNNELVEAAVSYALYRPEDSHDAITWWPWNLHSFKPKTRRANLVRATALLLAAIEQLDAKEAASETPLDARP